MGKSMGRGPVGEAGEVGDRKVSDAEAADGAATEQVQRLGGSWKLQEVQRETDPEN